MAFNHRLEPFRIDGKQYYNIIIDNRHYGYIKSDLGGFTVIDGPIGTNIIYPTMKSARAGIDKVTLRKDGT